MSSTTNIKQDPQFGTIIDFESLRPILKRTYDHMLPDYNMVEAVVEGTRSFDDHPSKMIAAGASMLAWSMLLAAEEYEIAEELKDKIFTLGWTEEHIGSDLLSLKTAATPVGDDPDTRDYHIKGSKWLINNSFHADYHMVLAKIDPTQNGPRSLSLFLVPHSSTKNWERLETHVLKEMVLTKFDIDGPGTLVGRKGHALSIVQRMAMPSKYQCSYMGMRMTQNAVSATLDHLSNKTIFDTQPIKFSNVFRQMYNIVLESAYLHFMFYRALTYSDTSFLQFHGTMLKSWLLLRANAVLSENLLVAGSKGFTKESIIGRDAFDSFVLPVFDGHYTINTLMTAKHMSRYLGADTNADAEDRIVTLREHLFSTRSGGQMNKKPGEIRRPDFYSYSNYWQQLDVPLEIDIDAMLERVQQLMTELDETGASSEAEYKYKTGTLVHWLEAVLGAAEMWATFENDHYLNVIVRQYNAFVKAFNDIISEGALQTPFMSIVRHQPLPEVADEDKEAFLRDLLDVEAQIQKFRDPVTE